MRILPIGRNVEASQKGRHRSRVIGESMVLVGPMPPKCRHRRPCFCSLGTVRIDHATGLPYEGPVGCGWPKPLRERKPWRA